MNNPGFDDLTRRIFAVTSRRTALASLAGVIALLAGWLTRQPAVAQQKRNVCRPLGGSCFPGRGVGCCGKAACRQGRCRCARGERACGGRCISKQRCCRDRDCGRGQRCQQGRCTGQCPAGKQRCGTRCVNLKTAKGHCGACGNACAGTATCRNGACVGGGAYREVRRWGEDRLVEPTGIAVDQAGFAYVTDYDAGSGFVRKYTREGTYVTEWTTGTSRPAGIEVAQGVVYVVTETEVQASTTNGTATTTVATVEGRDVAVNRRGEIYVVNTVDDRVDRFDRYGTRDTRWEASFDDPRGVAVGANGDVYVTDFTEKTVTRLSRADSSRRPWAGDDRLVNPAGIAADAAGFIYVVDRVDVTRHRVQKFTADGDFVGTIGDEVLKEVVDVIVSRSGIVYVADAEGDVIIQFAPA